MKIKTVVWPILTILVLVFGFGHTGTASVTATGTFSATKKCQAYQSKNNRTNPGDIRLETGKSYPVLELNVPSGTTWYRLGIEGATPQERWVYFECGTAEVTGQGEPPQTGGQTGGGSDIPCDIAGQ